MKYNNYCKYGYLHNKTSIYLFCLSIKCCACYSKDGSVDIKSYMLSAVETGIPRLGSKFLFVILCMFFFSYFYIDVLLSYWALFSRTI